MLEQAWKWGQRWTRKDPKKTSSFERLYWITDRILNPNSDWISSRIGIGSQIGSRIGCLISDRIYSQQINLQSLEGAGYVASVNQLISLSICDWWQALLKCMSKSCLLSCWLKFCLLSCWLRTRCFLFREATSGSKERGLAGDNNRESTPNYRYLSIHNKHITS